MYTIIFSARAGKSLRKYAKGGSFPEEKFERALRELRAQGQLPAAYRDHKLAGSLAMYREFHLAQDILVQYSKDTERRLIMIVKIGTHSELFG